MFRLSIEAVRFNLDDKREGPVVRFEQNRIYFGIGFKTTELGGSLL